jgi:hypothetical protein
LMRKIHQQSLGLPRRFRPSQAERLHLDLQQRDDRGDRPPEAVLDKRPG